MHELTFLDPETPEWDYAWKELGKLEINAACHDSPACADHITGEVWQYMGTSAGRHQFRHRRHPHTDNREYVDIWQSDKGHGLHTIAKHVSRDGRDAYHYAGMGK